MKIIYKLVIPFCFLLGLFNVVGCRKFVSDPEVRDEVTTSLVFKSDAAATSALLGIYRNMMLGNNLIFNGGLSLYSGLSSDDLEPTILNAISEPFVLNKLQANNSTINNMWSKAYSYIYHCNAILEGLENTNMLSPTKHRLIEGEVKFIRAFNYYYLVNLFGDVPLITSTDYRINAIIKRTSSNQVYTAILTDLKDALILMQGMNAGTDRLRVDEHVVRAMLARVYLSTGNWQHASDHATSVINSGKYILVSNLNEVFSVNSKETIWQMTPRPGFFNTSEGFSFIPASPSSRPAYMLSPYLLSSFESGDGRMISWVKANTVNNVEYSFPYKYKIRSNPVILENNIVMRLSEMYLIRAESQARLNNFVDAKADLDKIRIRAGLTENNSNGITDLLEAVWKERQTEFFAEWGHRWIDLKRTGLADSILSIRKSNWQSTAVLYPIPLNEIETNNNLNQNPGYE